jgi:hypothetical protein
MIKRLQGLCMASKKSKSKKVEDKYDWLPFSLQCMPRYRIWSKLRIVTALQVIPQFAVCSTVGSAAERTASWKAQSHYIGRGVGHSMAAAKKMPSWDWNLSRSVPSSNIASDPYWANSSAGQKIQHLLFLCRSLEFVFAADFREVDDGCNLVGGRQA